MEAIKTSVSNVPAEGEVKGKAVKKSGKRIGYNYIILKSLKESQKNDVVKCLYIKSLTNWGICVIKEGTYGDTKDKQGRDIKDRLMWQRQLHEQLQGKVRLPRLLGSFEENGNYYLVIERIKGKSLYKACREAGKDLREGLMTGSKLGMKFLDYMIQMIDLLETLHKNGIIHRDVTAANFMITPAGKVAVIDMELSYSLENSFPDPPFQLGTYGYMSPEQEAMAMPAYEQDVFSMAAIILMIWARISPSKLTCGAYDELSDRVHLLIPDKEFAEIVLQGMHPEPELRPTLLQLRQVVLRYKSNLQKKIKGPVTNARLYSRDEVLDTIQQSIGTLSSPILADKERGWFAENTKAAPNEDKKKIVKAWFASFSRGASGVIYTLSKANLVGLDVSLSEPYLKLGLGLVETRYINKLPGVNPSLHYGAAGIAATLATSIREGLIEPQTDYFDWINRLLELPSPALTIQDGIAGQGMANLISQPFLHRQKLAARLGEYVSRILEAQQKDGSWLKSMHSKRKRATKGFSEGVAGITFFLLEYSKQFESIDALHAAERGISWLAKKAIGKKDAFDWTTMSGKIIPPWFSKGAPGIAMPFMKAYALTGEKKYKQYAEGALRMHKKDAIDGSLGFDDGICGLGEVYLDAALMLGSEEYLERAGWITNFLMHMKMYQNGKGPYWLVQNERQPVADFATGNSGIIHFLLRQCHPEKIGFPLLAF